MQSELVFVQKENLDFYNNTKLQDVYNVELTAYFLTILKNWYLIDIDKEVSKESKEMKMLLENMFSQDYSKLKDASCNSFYDIAVVLSIRLFRISPWLWKHIVGYMRYKVGYRI